MTLGDVFLSFVGHSLGQTEGLVLVFHCCDEILGKKQEGLTLRGCSCHGSAGRVVGIRDGWPHCIHRQEAESRQGGGGGTKKPQDPTPPTYFLSVGITSRPTQTWDKMFKHMTL